MTGRVVAAGVAVLLLFVGQAQASTREEASIARGHAIVQRNCGVCHAVGERGTSPNPQAPLFRELHRRYEVDMLAEALAEGILTGHPAMPQFEFPPRQINDIIAYLKSIQTRGDARATRPARAHVSA